MANNDPLTPLPKADWTVMVYFAADNELERAAVANLEMMKQVGSIDGKLNLLAQLDTRTSSRTFRYRLADETTRLEEDVIETLPEINTGDPQELRAFLRWGQDKYPADHYLVVLWGHGNGWQPLTEPARAAGLTTNAFIDSSNSKETNFGHTLGINFQGKMRAYPCSYKESGKQLAEDVPLLRGTHLLRSKERIDLLEGFDAGLLDDATPSKLAQESRDVLSLEGLTAALAEADFAKPIDILGLDVCLMGFAEVSYAVHPSVRFLVASEDTVPLESWPYDRILRHLYQNTKMLPEELSCWIARDYLRFYSEKSRDATSAICTLSSWYNAAPVIRDFVDNLLEWLKHPGEKAEVLTQIVLARAYTQSFFVPNYVDLYDFCYRLGLLTTKETIRTHCRAVCQALYPGQPFQSDALVFNYGFTGFRVRDARGVSVYFPLVAPAASYGKVEFGETTHWHRFLLKLNEELSGDGDDKQIEAAVRGAGIESLALGVKAGQGNPEKAGQGNPEKAGQGNPEKIPVAPIGLFPRPPQGGGSAPTTTEQGCGKVDQMTSYEQSSAY